MPREADNHILPDVLQPGLALVFCGTAAGKRSAAERAYYAHPGNLFWRALFDAGLTPRQLAPSEFPLLPDYGIGLTDLAKRHSGNDNESEEEAAVIAALTRSLMDGLPGCVDLCDQLDWAELVQLVRLARRVISLDTAVAHVAGAVGTPAATLWTSPSSPTHWRPLGTRSVIVDCRQARDAASVLELTP